MEAPHFGIRLARAVSWQLRCLHAWCYQQRLPCGHAGLSGRRRRGEPRTKHTHSKFRHGTSDFSISIVVWVGDTVNTLLVCRGPGGCMLLCREYSYRLSVLSNRGKAKTERYSRWAPPRGAPTAVQRMLASRTHRTRGLQLISYYPTYHNPNVRTPHSRRIRASRAVPPASHNDYDKAGSTTTARRARVLLERRHAHRRWHRLRVVVVERVERC